MEKPATSPRADPPRARAEQRNPSLPAPGAPRQTRRGGSPAPGAPRQSRWWKPWGKGPGLVDACWCWSSRRFSSGTVLAGEIARYQCGGALATTTGLLCCTVEERAAHLAGLYHAVLARPTVDRSNIFGVACPRSKDGLARLDRGRRHRCQVDACLRLGPAKIACRYLRYLPPAGRASLDAMPLVIVRGGFGRVWMTLACPYRGGVRLFKADRGGWMPSNAGPVRKHLFWVDRGGRWP